MLLFRNEAAGTYFTVNTIENKVVFAPGAVYRWVRKNYSSSLVLLLPNLDTVKRLRKIVETGVYHKLSADDLTIAIRNDYPELFI